MRQKILCFGEILLRLSTSDPHSLLHSGHLQVTTGGAETNVAVGLSHFGMPTKLFSALPRHQMGEDIIRHLRGFGIDTSNIIRRDGRLGLYFFQRGADRRPGQIIYDRNHSVFTQLNSDEIDIDALLNSVKHVHLSGITPALGQDCAELTLKIAEGAKRYGIGLSFDFNFRQNLWDAWDSDPAKILTRLVECSTVVFANDYDLTKILGSKDQSKTRSLTLADSAFDRFPRLELLTSAYRNIHSVETQSLCAELITRKDRYKTREVLIENIVDRIGAGDAYAAGVIFGHLNNMSLRDLADFAFASSIIKHTTPGDFPRASVEDVKSYFDDIGRDVKR